MFLSMILFLAVCMMPGTSGMKPTNVNVHEYAKDGLNSIESMTEVTWNSIKSMHVKVKLPVKAQTSELPISVYHDLYKYWVATKQTMTRIASVAILWTPTSSKFSEMATLIVIDGRFKDDGIKSGKKELMSTGKLNVDLVGSTITAVPFDPNFQQFITGSLDFATDTLDINKIRFYISFPDTRMANTDSTAGFFDISWKTLPDDNGVYERVQWDVFTFEKQLPAEVAIMSGENNFQKIKNYLDKKYNERKEALRQLEDFSNALVWGTDQGLNKMKSQLNEDVSASHTLVRDSSKRMEAIRIKNIQTEISVAKSKLAEALAGNDINAIKVAKDALIAVFKKNNMQVPVSEDKDDGYVLIGEAQ
ncbi:movement protein [Pueraria lobata-associated emaravirus]|uniref:Movement protein n=1 Tax=Pueraria lobata-associated emaravirus TaxID=2944626 RepID=A0AAE9KZ84_9VIRU|nr:movement protein [Pueraria lobata-associated emaravirus]